MAQGKTVLAKKAGSGGRGSSGNLKKGKRVIAPKSRVEINHKVMQKVDDEEHVEHKISLLKHRLALLEPICKDQ